MRYRLMATYRGVPYEVGIGPTDGDVVLFAACPPPEDLGFQPATGHWRKVVTRAEVDALWESSPAGVFRGEPCMVLDDLGEQLHIAYRGKDPRQAEMLGYCQVEPGVFEVLTLREDVTGITEERVEHPFPTRRRADRSRPLSHPYPGPPDPWPHIQRPSAQEVPAYSLGAPGRSVPASAPPAPPDHPAPWPAQPPAAAPVRSEPPAYRPAPEGFAPEAFAPGHPDHSGRMPAAPDLPVRGPVTLEPPAPGSGPVTSGPVTSSTMTSGPMTSGPMTAAASMPAPGMPAGAMPTVPRPARGEQDTGSATAAPYPEPYPDRRHDRAGGPPVRAQIRHTFSELANLAAMSRGAYAVDEIVDGAICLVGTGDGFEVFTAADGARQEVRLFDDEEAAYFYLFGLLAAEAVRDGRLVPSAGRQGPAFGQRVGITP
jgi:hypothetical protein